LTPRWRGRHSQLVGWLPQQVGESHRCSATEKSQTRAAAKEKQHHTAGFSLRSMAQAVHSPVRTWRGDERATCADRMRQRGGTSAQPSGLSRARRCGRCVRGAVAALPHGGSASHEQVLWRQSGCDEECPWCDWRGAASHDSPLCPAERAAREGRWAAARWGWLSRTALPGEWPAAAVAAAARRENSERRQRVSVDASCASMERAAGGLLRSSCSRT
jgi:hypothetical protein